MGVFPACPIRNWVREVCQPAGCCNLSGGVTLLTEPHQRHNSLSASRLLQPVWRCHTTDRTPPEAQLWHQEMPKLPSSQQWTQLIVPVSSALLTHKFCNEDDIAGTVLSSSSEYDCPCYEAVIVAFVFRFTSQATSSVSVCPHLHLCEQVITTPTPQRPQN